MWRNGIPALDIWVRAVRRNEWVETPTTPMRSQAFDLWCVEKNKQGWKQAYAEFKELTGQG